jgi:hypothetical protein
MTEDRLLVLRFRDIEVELGETIRQHRLLINMHGYAWWGWLFRDFEANPERELAQYKKLLGPGKDLALYDTGQGRVFRAFCEDVVASPRPRRSPSLDHTPLYYRTRNAPAWFKLKEIEEVAQGYVLGRRCVSLPSATDECFIDLQGQVVSTLRDLRRQEVTMWLLGPQVAPSTKSDERD